MTFNLKHLFLFVFFCKTIFLFSNPVKPINTLYLYHATIKNKAFFSCYRNPFDRFGLSLSEVKWEVGCYNADTILKDFVIILERKNDSNLYHFSFQDKFNKTILSENFSTMANLNDSIYELKIGGLREEFENQLNCSKLLESYYLIIEKEDVFLFYGDYSIKENLILQFKRKK